MLPLNSKRTWLALATLLLLLTGCIPKAFTPTATVTAPPPATAEAGALPPQVPGVNPRELAQDLVTVHQFTCDDLVVNERGYYEWRCRRESPGVELEVTLFSRTKTELDLLDANVNQSQPSDEQAIALLSFIAGLLPLSDESQQAAGQWIVETLPDIAENEDVHSRLFDDILFRLYGAPETHSLEIGALPPF